MCNIEKIGLEVISVALFIQVVLEIRKEVRW